MIDPIIHTHESDCLEAHHPLAYVNLCCDRCGVLVHAGNNECMRTWVEYKAFTLCGACAAPMIAIPVFEPAAFIARCTGH